MLKCHLCFLYHFVFRSDWEKHQCMEYLYCYYYYRLYTEYCNQCYLVIFLMAKNLWNENKWLNWKFWFVVVGLFFSPILGVMEGGILEFHTFENNYTCKHGAGFLCWWGVFLFWGLIFLIYFKTASEIWCTLKKEKLKYDSYECQIL